MVHIKENKNQSNHIDIFKDWYKQASVVNKPRRKISKNELEGKIFFPPELFPVVSHPFIQKRGKFFTDKLLLYRLYSYLDFTECLENEIVNPITYKIANNRLNIKLPKKMRIDAYKICVDEAYHALFSVDIKTQIEEVTGVGCLAFETPEFLQRFNYIEQTVDSDLREIVKVFFTIVSETLITGILTDVPRNKNVVNTVREVILDHARDESRHHSYFANLLEIVWLQLKPESKLAIGCLLPQIIFAYLEPDIAAIKSPLRAMGLEEQEIDIILAESYPKAKLSLSIKKSASATLKHFHKNGVLEIPHVAEAFEKSGLY